MSTDDALTIRFRTGRVRLAGLEDLPRRTVCLAEGQMWGCGQQARAALYNLVRSRAVVCEAGKRLGRDLVLAACSAEGQDLATAQVAAGWARPSNPSPMDQAAAQAKAENRGLWRGGWTLRDPVAKTP
jgi:endonuclease YncB( thermonuclease family)